MTQARKRWLEENWLKVGEQPNNPKNFPEIGKMSLDGLKRANLAHLVESLLLASSHRHSRIVEGDQC